MNRPGFGGGWYSRLGAGEVIVVEFEEFVNRHRLFAAGASVKGQWDVPVGGQVISLVAVS